MTNNPLNDPTDLILYALVPNSSDDDCACAEMIIRNEDAEIENDCACAEMVPSHSRAPSEALYQQAPGLYTEPLVGEFRLVMGPASPVGPVVMNQASWEKAQAFHLPRQIKTSSEREMVYTGLLVPASGTVHPESAPHTLTAWLHVTNDCNLDCPYCYVKKSTETMRLEKGREALARLFATAVKRGFRQIKLKYAGGEPTLCFHLVQALHEEARRLSQETGIGLREVVLSNGTNFHPAQADWLRENNVRLMISLDGIGADHDRTRSLHNGEGTFLIVERTIDEILLPREIHPTVSITVTGLNASGIAEAVRWVFERNLPLSINFYRVPPGTTPAEALTLEEERIIAGMESAYRVVEEILPVQPFVNGLLDRFRVGAHQWTCGVGRTYVVIDHTGQLAPCHMQLGATPGVAADMLSQLSFAQAQNLPVEEKERCKKCRFRFYCTGGCPLESYRATGRWNAPSPNCRIYQTLIPQVLRLEGLRLLKQKGLL